MDAKLGKKRMENDRLIQRGVLKFHEMLQTAANSFALGGWKKTTRLLRKVGVTPSIDQATLDQRMLQAWRESNYGQVEFYLSLGANPELPVEKDQNIIEYSIGCWWHYIDTFQSEKFIQADFTQCIEAALKHGANPNHPPGKPRVSYISMCLQQNVSSTVLGLFLKHGADPYVQISHIYSRSSRQTIYSKGGMPFIFNVLTDAPHLLPMVLEGHPDLEKRVVPYGTPLEVAINVGRASSVCALIQAGANPNGRTVLSASLLEFAINRSSEIVTLLVKAGANEMLASNGSKMICLALKELDAPAIECMLDHGHSIESFMGSLDLLDLALQRSNSAPIVEMLLRKGFEPVEVRHVRQAIATNHPCLFRLIRATDSIGMFSEQIVRNCSKELVEQLIPLANMNMVVSDGCTLLQLLLSVRHLKDFWHLLDLNAQVGPGVTVLEQVLQLRDPHLIKKLVERSINFNARLPSSKYPIEILMGASEDCFKEMMFAGVNLNVRLASGQTPLETALENNQLEAAKNLIKNGARQTRESILRTIETRDAGLICWALYNGTGCAMTQDEVTRAFEIAFSCAEHQQSVLNASLVKEHKVAERLLETKRGPQIASYMLMNKVDPAFVCPTGEFLAVLAAKESIGNFDKYNLVGNAALAQKLLDLKSRRLIHIMLDQGLSLETRASNGETILEIFLERGDTDDLTRARALIKTPCSNGMTPVQFIMQKRFTQLFKSDKALRLVQLGAETHGPFEGASCLIEAVLQTELSHSIAMNLLKIGVTIPLGCDYIKYLECDTRYYTQDDKQRAMSLVEHGASPCFNNKNGYNYLWGEVDRIVIEDFIRLCKNLCGGSITQDGVDLLEHCIQKRKFRHAELLVENGYNLTGKLAFAKSHRAPESLLKLIATQQAVEEDSLVFAVQSGDRRLLMSFLNKGAMITDEVFQTACEHDESVLASLVRGGLAPNARCQGRTLIERAVARDDRELLVELLERGANVRIMTADNISLLEYALSRENSFMAVRILKRGGLIESRRSQVDQLASRIPGFQREFLSNDYGPPVTRVPMIQGVSAEAVVVTIASASAPEEEEDDQTPLLRK